MPVKFKYESLRVSNISRPILYVFPTSNNHRRLSGGTTVICALTSFSQQLILLGTNSPLLHHYKMDPLPPPLPSSADTRSIFVSAPPSPTPPNIARLCWLTLKWVVWRTRAWNNDLPTVELGCLLIVAGYLFWTDDMAMWCPTLRKGPHVGRVTILNFCENNLECWRPVNNGRFTRCIRRKGKNARTLLWRSDSWVKCSLFGGSFGFGLKFVRETDHISSDIFIKNGLGKYKKLSNNRREGTAWIQWVSYSSSQSLVAIGQMHDFLLPSPFLPL